ncbi:MAG: FtsW/RodA/SpoVE family cell cycle protein [Bacteroidales bacterium]|nr:FtsW/RodA/SpoVE family cell cycle protein [Bacteroidales bacterium]
MRKLRVKGDKAIWGLVILLAMISILAVFSASTYRANVNHMEKTALFLQQIRLVLGGFLCLLICYVIPLKWYRGLAFLFFGGTTLMLLLTFVPGFQDIRNGAVRGVKIFGKSIQVFEFAKVGLILYLAKAVEYWEDSLDTFRDFAIKLLLPVAGTCLLVMANSFSSALLFGFISFLLLWFMGVKLRFLLISAGGAVAGVLLLFGIYNAFYAGRESTEEPAGKVEKIFNRFGTVQHRLASYFDSDKEDEETKLANMTAAQKQAYLDNKRQSENAKVAISQGGLIGKGPGKSTQRYSLSMAFSDFIFAFIVEEYGLLGGTFVILLYMIFLFRCITIGSRCQTPFSGAVVIGLGFLIAIQAMLHIYVNIRLLPITGHTLPLISHGGTAFVVLSGAFGIILSVSRQLDVQEAEQRITEDNQNE